MTTFSRGRGRGIATGGGGQPTPVCNPWSAVPVFVGVMGNYTGFALGILVGCGGLLLAQSFTRKVPEAAPQPTAERTSLLSGHLERQLADARARITDLETELAVAVPALEIEASEHAEVEATPEDADKAASFLETMMSFGDGEAKRKIEKEVERLAGVLGLTENQQAVVREALLKKVADQKAAGLRLVTGRASIADLVASDEHNFVQVDAAIQGVLDAEQLELFAAEQEQREVKRVEAKTEEEIGRLAGAIELSDDQRDAAWAALAEINAGEKPGDVPEGTTGEDFVHLIDAAIGRRVDGMTPILTPEQLSVYQGQTQEFRTMITTLVGHATGTPLP